MKCVVCDEEGGVPLDWPLAPEQQLQPAPQDDGEVVLEDVEVRQEFQIETEVLGEAQQGDVVTADQLQQIAAVPPNLIQLLVQQQQMVQQQKTVQQQHMVHDKDSDEPMQPSPVASLPVPRFNTPSPDLNARQHLFQCWKAPLPFLTNLWRF